MKFLDRDGVGRREFLKGAVASLGGVILPVSAFGDSSKKLLSFGVVSDVHMASKPTTEKDLESVLRHFDAAGVDAVMVPGDISHTGLICEFERFAQVWYTVFPNDRGADGRSVEKLFVSGNHCLDGWCGRWNGWSEARLKAERFHFADNARKVWDRLFHEEYKLIWEKQVKGVTFIGAQWMCLLPPVERPPIEEFFRAKRGKLDPNLPFFYTQHAHPANTCHRGRNGADGNGGVQARRALSAFPNAVAITGHSHCTLMDDLSVWQGEFTSIGAGCLHDSGSVLDYANASWGWYEPSQGRIMKCMDSIGRGGCVMIVDVFEDHLVLHRRSVRYGMPLGEDWAVPLPAAYGKGFDFKVREKQIEAPQFPAGAVAYVTFHPEGHPAAKPEFAKVPCYSLRFPSALTPHGHLFDYLVEISVNGRLVKSEALLAGGFCLPKSKRPNDELYLVRAADLPSDAALTFAITPRECFGRKGRSLNVGCGI